MYVTGRFSLFICSKFLWTKSFYKGLKFLLCIYKMIRCILSVRRWSTNRYKLHTHMSNGII